MIKQTHPSALNTRCFSLKNYDYVYEFIALQI